MSGQAALPFPHAFRPLTAAAIYRRASLALAVVVVAAILRGGWAAAAVVAGSLGGALAGDLVAALCLTEPPLSRLRTSRGVALGLVVAAATPLATGFGFAFIAGFLALVVGVWLPGGPGRYWLHPAFIGVALAMIVLPGYPPPAGIQPVLAAAGEPGALAESLSAFLQRFGLFVPARTFDIFLIIDLPADAPLAAGLLLPTLVASLVVFGEDLVPPLLPATYFIAWAMVTWAVGGLPESWWAGEPLSVAAASIVPLILFFVLIEPGTRPLQQGGLALFGLVGGVLTALLQWVAAAGAPEIVAILIAGTLVPLIDWLHLTRGAR